MQHSPGLAALQASARRRVAGLAATSAASQAGALPAPVGVGAGGAVAGLHTTRLPPGMVHREDGQRRSTSIHTVDGNPPFSILASLSIGAIIHSCAGLLHCTGQALWRLASDRAHALEGTSHAYHSRRLSRLLVRALYSGRSLGRTRSATPRSTLPWSLPAGFQPGTPGVVCQRPWRTCRSCAKSARLPMTSRRMAP